jgi:hypothetical protein
MRHPLWFRRTMIIAAALVIIACIGATVWSGSATPEPLASAAMGPDWQCSRVAFILTSCTPSAQPETVGMHNSAARLVR